ALKAPTLVPTRRSGASPALASTSITPTWNAPRLAPPLRTTARRLGRVAGSHDNGRIAPLLPRLRRWATPCARAVGAGNWKTFSAIVGVRCTMRANAPPTPLRVPCLPTFRHMAKSRQRRAGSERIDDPGADGRGGHGPCV